MFDVASAFSVSASTATHRPSFLASMSTVRPPPKPGTDYAPVKAAEPATGAATVAEPRSRRRAPNALCFTALSLVFIMR